MNDKYKNIFDIEMENKDVDPIQRVSNAMKAMSKAMVTDAPMWMRFNYILNGIGGVEDKDINWNAINEILTTNVNKYDFNIVENTKTIEGIINARANSIAASMGLGAWQKHKCKECGEDFYMSKGEVDFFETKGFNLPKRCKHCRSGEKKLKATSLQNKKPEVPEKTAMQLAMERAGMKI